MPHTLNALRCGSIAVDTAGRVRHWSAGAARVFGLSAEEMTGEPLARLWPDASGPAQAEELLRQALLSGEEDRLVRMRRGDGAEFTARTVTHPLPEGGACVTVIDAGPLGEHLRERGELVQLLQRVAVAANEAETTEETLRTALRYVCETTGWSLGHAMLLDGTGSLESTGLFECVAPERFAAFVEDTRRRRFGSGEGAAGSVLRDGRPLWIHDVAADPRFIRRTAAEVGLRSAYFFPVLSGREVVGVLEFFSDAVVEPTPALLEAMASVGAQVGRVVERVRAARAVRDTETRFSSIISISTDAVVSVDEAQRITFFNRGAEQIFGYTPEEVVGERLELLIPERFRAGHEAQVQEFGASPVEARRMGERGQISGRRKGGEEFPADASISKIVVGGSRIYTAVVRDVTQRQQAEEALAQQARELARSNAELEQFAYVASHDLQEPLRMVASYTQLLARRYKGRLDDDAEEFIGYAVDGVRRMQSLINDLLAYSRVGTRGGRPEPTDAGAALERVLRTLGPAIEEAGARVTHDALPTVTVDAMQFDQLLQNLVANAIKFHGEAPPHVHVSARQTDDAWEFAVRDNGIGIAPEFAERIFVIFQRLHGRDEYPGTGVGLSICKKIVERHGGRIWLESEVGRGTTFYFTLPRREDDA